MFPTYVQDVPSALMNHTLTTDLTLSKELMKALLTVVVLATSKGAIASLPGSFFNTRPIQLLVVSLTSLMAQSRLYKEGLCLLRVQYHSLLGHSQGVIQRRIMLTVSSVSLLTGVAYLQKRSGCIIKWILLTETSPGCNTILLLTELEVHTRKYLF